MFSFVNVTFECISAVGGAFPRLPTGYREALETTEWRQNINNKRQIRVDVDKTVSLTVDVNRCSRLASYTLIFMVTVHFIVMFSLHLIVKHCFSCCQLQVLVIV